MGYKLLGWVVFNGGRWALRRRYGHLIPSRGVALGVLGALVVLAAGLAAASRSGAE